MAITYSITTPPSHGTASIDGGVLAYEHDAGYEGSDSLSYSVMEDGVEIMSRRVCIDVVTQNWPTEWRPTAPACVLIDNKRNGMKYFALLEEIDTFTKEPTGVTKPNTYTDPDYVLPVYDPVFCVPE